MKTRRKGGRLGHLYVKTRGLRHSTWGVLGHVWGVLEHVWGALGRLRRPGARLGRPSSVQATSGRRPGARLERPRAVWGVLADLIEDVLGATGASRSMSGASWNRLERPGGVSEAFIRENTPKRRTSGASARENTRKNNKHDLKFFWPGGMRRPALGPV